MPSAGKPVTVKADELESLTLNNNLRAIVDSAASSLLLQSLGHRRVRATRINTLSDQPESASREGGEHGPAGRGRRRPARPARRDLGQHRAGAGHRRHAPTRGWKPSASSATEQQSADPPEADARWWSATTPANSKRPDADVARRRPSRPSTRCAASRGRAELLGNLFTGLSLGSVLLLAALGPGHHLRADRRHQYGARRIPDDWRLRHLHGADAVPQHYAPNAFDWYLACRAAGVVPGGGVSRLRASSGLCCATCTAARSRRCWPPSVSACC